LGDKGISFSSWKVAGTAGGESNIDPVRGALAEGGLYGERLGWHLPGYPDSHWNDTTSPSTDKSGAGVTFYRTVVPLDIPAGLDVSLSFVLKSPPGSTLRAQLFVGGYQYGRYVP
jgi:beta-galactosidase GanA